MPAITVQRSLLDLVILKKNPTAQGGGFSSDFANPPATTQLDFETQEPTGRTFWVRPAMATSFCL